ncbi:tetratricopeptide repeat protein [Thermogemmatispora sp.]|uniref:tetratricopeptide repeat protein n=1 Tax=Thermogemmatispora sp. TaxID=1968838 RepID=UPI001D7E243A|nr:tetratricopeptide repeat protein [Thermogemmatispora sp.]MBX5449146.1 tetratricopeptide repeat protein [Thermogemmatispora sp.]
MDASHHQRGSYRPASSPIEAWERAGERLRILLVVSSPIDEPERLNAELEIQEIYRQLLWSRVPAALIRLHPPTWRSLQTTLHARPFDIVHVISHARDSELQLEKEDGSTDWVSAQDLAALFRQTQVRLVVLNNCSSEYLGDELVLNGVPAVIATTRQLANDTATLLASALYASLARGSSAKEALEFIQRTLQREPGQCSRQGEVVTLLGPGAEEPLRPGLVNPGEPEYFPCEPPHNLPLARARNFRDRVSELQRLAELLSNGPTPFIGLLGLAGSGKSTLALELAHRASWRFTRGIAYISLRRTRPFDLVSLLTHLDWGLEETSARRQRALALYEMARGPLLLVLDDLEEASSEEAQDICDLLSAWDTSLGGRALLLMRHHRPEFDQLLQTNWLTVGQLPAQAACELVEEQLGGREAARARLGRHLPELPRLCYYHPKLLTLATSALQRGIPWQELATQLRQLAGKPLRQMEQLLHLTITRVIAESPLAGQLLDCWPVFAETTAEAAWRFVQAGRLPLTTDRLWQQQNEALEALQYATILERGETPSGPQCRMHPLISDYLRLHRWNELSQERRTEYQRRHLQYYIEVCKSNREVERLLYEWDDIALAIEQAQHLGLWEELLTLAEELVGVEGLPLLKRHQSKQALQILQVALEASARLQQPAREAVFLLHRGICYYRLAEYQQAYQDVASSLQLARRQGNEELISAAELELGRVCYRLMRYEEAEQHFATVHAQATSRGDQRRQADALHELGRLAYRRRQLESALRFLNEALQLWERLGDQAGLARTLHEQGRVHHELALQSQTPGKLDEAEALYLRSLMLRQQLSDHLGQEATLHQLGLLAFHRGDLQQAGSYYAQSMRLARELNDRFWIAHNQFRSARLLWREGQQQEALAQAQEALALCQVLGISLQREIEDWLQTPA